MNKQNDPDYEELRIRLVEDNGKSLWTFTCENGIAFWVDKKYGVKPRIGNVVRFYFDETRSVRGLYINGRKSYYHTREEQAKLNAERRRKQEASEKALFRKNRPKLDAQYRSLPEVFKHRIDKFRQNNPDFRWKYEAYEMYVCTQAVKIAEAAQKAEVIRSWDEGNGFISFEKAKSVVPGLDDGHSGNTFGAACLLAILYLSNQRGVVRHHGAMAPLVGSKEYGYVPVSPAAKT